MDIIQSFKEWLQAYCNGRKISFLQQYELQKAYFAGWISGIGRQKNLFNKYNSDTANEIVEKELDEAIKQLKKDYNSYRQN